MAIRLRSWLSGLWGGGLLTIALIAAPALFAVLQRPQAGLVAGRIFRIEAFASLAFAAVLYALERGISRPQADQAQASRLSVELLLIFGALFCTVAGHFALLPMFEAARAGHGSLSFGALHTISTLFYALKTVLVLVLAWRCAAR